MYNYMCHHVSLCLLHAFVAKGTQFLPQPTSPQHLVPSCFFGRSARPFERAQPLAGLALEPMGLHDLGDQLCPGLSELPRLSGGNCSTSQFTPWKKNEKERKRKKKRPNHPNPMNNTTGTHPWYDSWAHPSTIYAFQFWMPSHRLAPLWGTARPCEACADGPEGASACGVRARRGCMQPLLWRWSDCELNWMYRLSAGKCWKGAQFFPNWFYGWFFWYFYPIANWF